MGLCSEGEMAQKRTHYCYYYYCYVLLLRSDPFDHTHKNLNPTRPDKSAVSSRSGQQPLSFSVISAPSGHAWHQRLLWAGQCWRMCSWVQGSGVLSHRDSHPCGRYWVKELISLVLKYTFSQYNDNNEILIKCEPLVYTWRAVQRKEKGGKKEQEKGQDSTTATTSSSMDSTPADMTYIPPPTHTHTHSPHSKSNDVIYRKRWREYRFS